MNIYKVKEKYIMIFEFCLNFDFKFYFRILVSYIVYVLIWKIKIICEI